jgi:hypothetical protein
MADFDRRGYFEHQGLLMSDLEDCKIDRLTDATSATNFTVARPGDLEHTEDPLDAQPQPGT